MKWLETQNRLARPVEWTIIVPVHYWSPGKDSQQIIPAKLAKSQLRAIKQLRHTQTDNKYVWAETRVCGFLSQPDLHQASQATLDLLHSTLLLLPSPELRSQWRQTDPCTESSQIPNTSVKDAESLGKEHSRSSFLPAGEQLEHLGSTRCCYLDLCR